MNAAENKTEAGIGMYALVWAALMLLTALRCHGRYEPA